MIPLLILETIQNKAYNCKTKQVLNDIRRIESHDFKQVSQVYVKTFHLIFVYLKPKCHNFKRIGAPEVKRHFEVLNAESKAKSS